MHLPTGKLSTEVCISVLFPALRTCAREWCDIAILSKRLGRGAVFRTETMVRKAGGGHLRRSIEGGLECTPEGVSECTLSQLR